MSTRAKRIVSIVGIVVGGTSTILQLLVAFGVAITDAQMSAIGGVAGLVLLIVSAWFNPDVPVGDSIVAPEPPE